MELLVVIAVIGLLSSIIFAITRGADEQGRIAKGLYFSQHLHNSLGSWAAGIWSFDEGAGTTANDISGWDNNGTLVNTPTWRCATTDPSYTPSGQGCSLEFNGSTQYVNVENNTSLNIANTITVEAWVKFNSLPGGAGADIIDRGCNGYSIWLRGDNKKFSFIKQCDGSTSANQSTTVASVAVWYHIAGTYDGSIFRIYVNGKLENSLSYTTTFTSIANIAIGKGGDGFVNGLIDEVRIYATSLSLSQVQSQYYVGLERLLAKNLIDEQEYQQRLLTKI